MDFVPDRPLYVDHLVPEALACSAVPANYFLVLEVLQERNTEVIKRSCMMSRFMQGPSLENDFTSNLNWWKVSKLLSPHTFMAQQLS